MPFLQRITGRRNFRNCEGRKEYDFALRRPREEGVSAMVRVKNEGQKLRHCLRSILPVFDEIVVADNGSDDRSVEVVRSVIENDDVDGKIRLLSYPFELARFGPEHDATDGNSLHSAVYFTNWTLSHCRRRYVCKWDGDMVLAREVSDEFGAFLAGLAGRPLGCWVLAGQTIYRDRERGFLLARGEVNREIEIFPGGPDCFFRKARNWERLKHPRQWPVGAFDPVCFYELKFVDEDEFAHWSTREWPSERKQREWANFQDVAEGRVETDRFESLPPSFLDDQVAV